MLTTAQQKVKQELEELQLNAYIHPNDKQCLLVKDIHLKR